MKSSAPGFVLVAAFCFVGVPAGAQTREKGVNAAATPAATFEEMKTMMGAIPSFIKQFPEAAVPAAWQEWKALRINPNTTIPGKYKNLISLGVSAQVPCTQCVYWDTQAAKADEATQQEIAEAVTMAAITRKWSTVLNGGMQDEAAFRKEASQIFAHTKQQKAPPSTPVTVTDAASATRDIEQTLGTVPTFMRRYPQAALPGAWLEFKTVQLNPKSALPPKYKELLGLAVAAQIPCRYCIHFHGEAAKANGASQAELDEAIAIAAVTRHWSTFLSGVQTDEKTFKKEVDGIFRHIKKTAGRSASGTDRREMAPPAAR